MTRTVVEILGKEAIIKLRRPVAEARGLPGAAYTSEEFYQLEQERLFPRTWMGVAFAHEIPDPGDAIPVTVAGLPVILLCDKKGEIRAFHNICRHRAALVLREPGKGLSNLQCPYHAWTYGLDGKLKVTPYWDGTQNARDYGVDKSKNGLVPVRCGVWHDFIFVNIEGNAPPLEEYMRPVEKQLAAYELDTLKPGHSEIWEFNANWKLLNDNWESYHGSFLHEGVIPSMSRKGGTLDMPAEGCCACLVARGQKTGAPDEVDLPRIPGAWESEGRNYTLVNIFPNTTMTCRPNHLAPVIYTPLAPDRTQARMVWYFVGEAATDPDFAERREAVLDRWLGKSRSPTVRDGVRSQDYGIMENQQVARSSPVADVVQFSPFWEPLVHRFQNMLIDALA